MATTKNAPSTGHAIVVGGSLAGLLAARVLSDHYSRVSVIERDRLPVEGVHRRGVPQSRHTHCLMASGRESMEELLPGLTEALAAEGASLPDLHGECRWYLGGHRMRQAMAGTRALLASRPLLEGHLRDRTRALDNVSILDGREVAGLVVDDTGQGVAGVRLLPAPDRGEETLRADLVVDATGRGARGVAWLREAGFEAPTEEQVEIDLVYTTRHFRRRPDQLGHDRAIIITTGDNRRGGTMNAQEDDTWIVTLFGYVGEQAPVDLAGFTEFAGSLDSKDIHDVVRDSEPVGDGAIIRYPASRRRHYQRLDRFPDRYLVLGDALCSFNPVYAQGMSVAATEARLLGDCLRDGLHRPDTAGHGALAASFFARVTPLLDVVWAMAVNEDLKYPEVQGERPPGIEEANAFLAQTYLAASRDLDVARSLVRLVNLQDRPEALQDPVFTDRVREVASRP
ncbi:FAD-dependent monooxygenase [Micromonospora sp. NBC_01699]|uniref:NAD(P)/FAD-dependent oxidoreductase n=1 Tax=Micromonospora sp. NBC_01699 TaxID=2975984 RepID=UPI002E2E4C2E|nr:FAD-dependent monooxygenase [Micromonospora sp. NBC_01699]